MITRPGRIIADEHETIAEARLTEEIGFYLVVNKEDSPGYPGKERFATIRREHARRMKCFNSAREMRRNGRTSGPYIPRFTPGGY